MTRTAPAGKWKGLRRWAMLAVVGHGLWEAGQLPLYALSTDPDRERVVRYLLHCVTGDVLIATTLFIVGAVLLRDFAWPVNRPWRGGALIIGAGLSYTALSEWYNVYQAHAWSYTAAMPLLFGIGLAPLLQWVVVPALMIAVFRSAWRRP